MAIVLSINKVVLAGRLVTDPLFREGTVGENGEETSQPFCRIRIAVQRPLRRKDREEGKTADADFFSATAYGRRAEILHSMYKRGEPIVVYGSMHQDDYTDKNGNRREGYMLVIDDFAAVERFARGEKGEKKDENREGVEEWQ